MVKMNIRVLFILFICCTLGCQSDNSSPDATNINMREGERLTNQYCGSCHAPVSPGHLDKKTWQDNVLPAMAPKLGISVYRKRQYYQDSKDSQVSIEEWQKIVRFFEQNAPDSLEIPSNDHQVKKDSTLFSIRKPEWADNSKNISANTLVAFHPSNHTIYTSDGMQKRLYRWNHDLESAPVKGLEITGVHSSFVKDSTGRQYGIFTSIGTLPPVDIANGKVWELNMENDSVRNIAEGLPRPVHSVAGDFNKDGLQDWIVCGFGHQKGGVYLLEQQEDRQFKKKAIRSVPGAVDAEVGDFNDDGWLDIMVLFAHGDEGIWLMLNDKKGGFNQENIIRFPPVYGSTSFQMEDFNRDGKLDIMYTSGDNADYSQILKPYHGIYIFINQGDFTFEQEYFYQLNGATEAVAKDFDGDGDLDIVAHAFFADLKNDPSESFIYLEQHQPLLFTPKTLDIHHLGRWLTMDVGDFEGDGDLDIILGNHSRQFIGEGNLNQNWNTSLPFILLLNNTQ